MNGLGVNIYSEGTGPRLVPWSVSLSPQATCRPNAVCSAIFLSVTLSQIGPTGGLFWNLWKLHIILIFIIVEVGCYCRTSLCLLCMSPTALWKSKFSKAPFCSSASLHTLLGDPAPGRKPETAKRTPSHLLFCDFAWSNASCYEIRVPPSFFPFHLERSSFCVSFPKPNVSSLFPE